MLLDHWSYAVRSRTPHLHIEVESVDVMQLPDNIRHSADVNQVLEIYMLSEKLYSQTSRRFAAATG